MNVRVFRTPSFALSVALVASYAQPAFAQDDATAAVGESATNQSPQEAARRAGRTTAVFQLRYAEAEAIRNVLRQTFGDVDDQLTLAVDEASNSLIVSATERTAAEIQSLLDKLDSPEMQNHPGARPPAQELRMFRLRNSLASEAAGTISDLYANRLGGRRASDDSLSVAVDERANYVIVHAPPRLLEEIAAVLQEIDAPARDAEPMSENADETGNGTSPPFQLFHLRHVEAESASKMLTQLLGRGDFRIVADKRLNALYVQAKEADRRLLASLLKTIDIEAMPKNVPTAASDRSPRRLLLYWLASGPSFKTELTVPRQLESVVEELNGIGLENLHLVCRSVAALDGDRITLNNTVKVGSRTFQLQLQGGLSSEAGEQDAPRLDLSLHAHDFDNHESSVDTTIQTPLDHYVVLGTTGLGDLENAFVIQIQSVEAPQ